MKDRKSQEQAPVMAARDVSVDSGEVKTTDNREYNKRKIARR